MCSSPIAVVFPGQGSQASGLGRRWLDRPEWQVVLDAEAATGASFAHLLLDADARELASTRASQMTVLLASLMAWQEEAPTLDPESIVGVAGHSLGQITALIAAGAVSPEDGYRLALARAEASEATQRRRPGGLVALLGADPTMASAVCAALTTGPAWVATLNGAGQVAIGAEVAVLDEVEAVARTLGCRRATRLAVDGAFHTPLHQPTADALDATLAGITFRSPYWPVVTNHDALPVAEASGWPARLAAHLVNPVRWQDTVEQLVSLGARRFVEVGPGSTLTGLIRRIAPELEAA